MPFKRPTLRDLITRIQRDLAHHLATKTALLRRSVLGVLARVFGGATHELHGHLDYLSQQAMIDTADSEHLARWANVWGVARKGAQFASGAIQCEGDSDSQIPANSVLLRADGERFITDQSVTFTSTTATVLVSADQPGSQSNTTANTVLHFESPIAGVASTVTTINGGLQGGANGESDHSLRQRLLDRIQTPPQGGAQHDYVAWACEVPHVTRAWVFPGYLGLGTIGVTFVCDDNPSLIPDADTVAAVQAHINQKRPVTAMVTVFAPIPSPLNITLSLTPNTEAVQTAVMNELRYWLQREANPGAILLLSHLQATISMSEGEYDHTLQSPTKNIPHALHEMPVLGEVTFS